MRRIVVTDSTADIPEELVKRLGVKVIPVNVILDGRVYRDGVDISRTELYNSFDEFSTMSTEPVRYEDYGLEFLQLIQVYDEIVIIHCTKHLSETYSTAVRINNEFNKNNDSVVKIIDSGQCSMGLGIMVMYAAEAMQKGESLEKIVHIVEKTKRNMNSYMAIPTLKYLKKNKKIGGAKALFGLAMGVKPVLEFDRDGKMVIKSKLFGKQKNMILSMIEKIKDDVGGRPITLSIIYSGNKNLVQNLKDVFEATFDCRNIYIARFGPSIAINAGPESYAVFFLPHDEERQMKELSEQAEVTEV